MRRIRRARAKLRLDTAEPSLTVQHLRVIAVNHAVDAYIRGSVRPSANSRRVRSYVTRASYEISSHGNHRGPARCEINVDCRTDTRQERERERDVDVQKSLYNVHTCTRAMHVPRTQFAILRPRNRYIDASREAGRIRSRTKSVCRLYHERSFTVRAFEK